ncbi:MAG: SCP2 sterol-binding domain-containing protein [Alphaproteobacteria bacterium]|nr:SCP2 sterol-binding domain-containing protein [Alphaproteobacteria bacterium]
MPANDEMMEKVIAALTGRIGSSSGINAAWTYDLGPHGHVFVDCRVVPHRIARTNGGGDCLFSLSLEDLWRLMSGRVDSQTIFTQGKIRLSGDMALVLKIDQLLGTYRVAQGS